MNQKLIDIIQTSGFTIELLAACIVFMLPLEKRRHFPLILTAGIVVSLFAANMFNFPDAGLALRIAKFALRYILALLIILLCCRITRTDALYCSISAYMMQHLASSFCFFLYAVTGNSSIAYNWYHPVQLLVLIPVYAVGWRFVARILPDNHRYNAPAAAIILMAVMVLSVTLILNTIGGVLYLQDDSDVAGSLYITLLLYDMFCCLFFFRRRMISEITRCRISTSFWRSITVCVPSQTRIPSISCVSPFLVQGPLRKE